VAPPSCLRAFVPLSLPFRMLASSARRPSRIDELISPALSARLDRLDVLSRRVFAGKMHGERRSKRRGQSVEFADYRNYVPGDDLRRIDWNVFARLDRFFIRIFQEEEDLALHVVLDASPSMDAGGPTAEAGNKLLFAQRLAMALAYIGLVNNNRVYMSVFDNRSLRRLAPVRGRRNVQRVAGFLIDALRGPATGVLEEDVERTALVGGGGKGDFTSALKAIALSRTGKGVMVVLSDFLIPEGYQEGLRYLAGAGGTGGGYDTYCLQILSPGELDPSKAGGSGDGEDPILGDLRLMDVETGKAAEVTITAELLAKYRAAVDRYTSELKAYATARGMSYALVRSDTDMETLLLDYLRRRGLLR